ncbi:hypothetical protein FACS1894216_19750 [Synergistales bacterium]|nr:hypothetical protein FACS1894216_19750 [Synergistales bacterium]
MANKLGEAIELTKRHKSDVARSAGNWFEFLQNTSAHYKYPFEDKVLLHAYRPDATACAELPQWNKTFRRWIRKGSSGIPLVSYIDGTPRLRYVFDISDTQQGKYVSSEKYRPVELWRMTTERRFWRTTGSGYWRASERRGH